MILILVLSGPAGRLPNAEAARIEAASPEIAISRLSPWSSDPSRKTLTLLLGQSPTTEVRLFEDSASYSQIQAEKKPDLTLPNRIRSNSAVNNDSEKAVVKESKRENELKAAAKLFDQVIYPWFLDFMQIRWSDAPKITLILDDIPHDKAVRAYVMRDYWKTENRRVIVMDTELATGPFFVVAALHEIQHIFYNFYRNDASSSDDDWLNEGLSDFVSSRLTETLPERSLRGALATSETPELMKWDWQSEDSSLSHRYAMSLLFVSYLHSHFGGDDLIRKLIRGPESGKESIHHAIQSLHPAFAEIPDQFLGFDSIYSNFSFALLLNDPELGSFSLFSLFDPDATPRAQSFQIRPEILAGNEKGELGPYQSKFFELVPGNCYQYQGSSDIRAYLVSNNGQSIRKVLDQACADEDPQLTTKLVLIRTTPTQTQGNWELKAE